MANYKHLGQAGLEQLLALLKAEFGLKVDKVEGFGLSKNDFTDELKARLEGIEEGANKYVHATHEAKDLAFYKVQIDGEGHVVGVQAVAKEDITALGIPGQDTTYVVATQTVDGLMAATDKAKLDGIEEGANKYVHATHTPAASGFYKITVDSEGHVSAATAVTKEDIVALGVPAQDTTYAEATQTQAGLMSAADKAKVDGLGTLASKSEVAESDLTAELAEKVNAAAEGNHSHANKEELDKIVVGDKAKWDEAYQKAHEHANKAELDKIAEGDKAKWDKAVEDLAAEVQRATKAEEANATAASNAQTKAEEGVAQANLNKTAIATLNGDETTAGSVAKTVKDYVDAKVASAYKAAGSVEFETLPEADAAHEGYVYNISNAFTTDADFVEGAGHKYVAGTNVVIVEIDGAYKYDVLAMSFDGFVQEADITEFSESDITTAWNNVFTA